MQAQSADGVLHEFPDGTDPSVIDNVMKSYAQQNAPVDTATDVAKSVAVAPVKGLISGAGTLGDVNSLVGSGVKWLGGKLGLPEPKTEDLPKPSMFAMPTSGQVRSGVEKVTGALYDAKTRSGKLASAPVEALTNPVSWIGPGSALLKGGTAAFSGFGSEVAGQATEGTGYEGAARLAGGLAGGVAGVKALGTKAPVAEIPASRAAWEAGPNGEKIITGPPGLKEKAVEGYNSSRAANVEFDPQGPAGKAAGIQNDLTLRGQSSDVAPLTNKLLSSLGSPEAGEFSTLTGIDNARQKLREYAKIVGADGKPTSEAAAAQYARKALGDYLEGDALAHVMVRDREQAAKLVQDAVANNPALKQQIELGNVKIGEVLQDAAKANASKAIGEYKTANQNYAAYKRGRMADELGILGEDQASRQTAGSVDRRIRVNAGRVQDKLTRSDTTLGYSGDEIGAISRTAKGSLAGRFLEQVGRGHGVLPIMAHMGTAVGTGGASIPISMAMMAGSYGSKKVAEALARKDARNLSETMRKRSPEYMRRKGSLPAHDVSPNVAAIVRALMTAK